MSAIADVAELLQNRLAGLAQPRDIFKAVELKELYAQLKSIPAEQRREFGQQVNQLRTELEQLVARAEAQAESATVTSIDVTAPFDINTAADKRPQLLPTQQGTIHPLTRELERVIDIFTRMGFEAHESRQIDDDWNMFGALNFPENHPARDGYDSFRTEENFIPPAHTSTMQNRVLKAGKAKLEAGEAIASVSYGRVYRNEDVDTTHDHTFYQQEGIYVSETANLGNMIAVLKSFYESYFGQSMNIKTQPGYFPFVEPGLEFCIERPASIGGKPGDWLEMLGCGMIHPNVLAAADIDPKKYRGFAWGGGVERMIMLRYGIEDLRHFESGKLQFLRKFA
ncbi:MAG TPA: phenylalanine--tRNA ligase subunit alpha [Candidatus Saccharimonadales bacterium]|jgi:phenylalanyl-tRNA synthetase alpha chain|nr:phenylalanine--tRNA ligase subunit alpha [Candidatus Saccharimonadales bacterium]